MSGPYRLESNPAAMVRLALGSSCTIATLMCIPDAFALIPNAPNLQVWAIRLMGLWLTACILWFAGFLGMLYAVRFFGGPTVLSTDGIRLWRFGRFIKWDSIQAVGVERQDLFARLFCLKPPVYRMTMYVTQKDGGLAPLHVPSFPYLHKEFRSLVVHILKATSMDVPDSFPFLVFKIADLNSLRRICNRTSKLRVALSILIAVGLVMFLGRRAIVSYEFNLGNKAFAVGNYLDASRHFKLAASTDPAFAMAWDRLARAEHRLGNDKDAQAHWHKALMYKPDLVDSKIGLAALYMENDDFDKARPLLEQCVRLSPHNAAAYLNLSRIALQSGNRQKAVSFLSSAIKEGNPDAPSYVACAKVSAELGMRQQAVELVRQALVIDVSSSEARSLLVRLLGDK